MNIDEITLGEFRLELDEFDIVSINTDQVSFLLVFDRNFGSVR